MTHTYQAERDVLAALLADGATMNEVIGLRPDDFNHEDHEALFMAIKELGPLPGPLPLALIGEQIHNHGKRSRLVGLAAELADVEVLPFHVPHLARILSEQSHRRRVSAAAALLQQNPGSEAAKAQLLDLIAPASGRRHVASSFVSAPEFLSASQAVEYVIAKLMETDTTGQLFGPSASGKTFIALDWALSVGTGSPANGNQVKQGLVLYCAGEGHKGLGRRVEAWKEYHGKTAEDLKLVHISRDTIRFDGSGLHVVKAEAQRLSETHAAPVALIVIDTLARHIEGDENSSRDMGCFISAVDSLRAAFPGCVALIVHHTGHSDDTRLRARGSSALKGALDFEINCDNGLLTFTKMKDSELPDPIEFNLLPVAVGTDSTGNPVTSCVVQYGSRAMKHRLSVLTPNQKLILEILKGDGPEMQAEDLREAFYAAKRKDDPAVKTNTLKNALWNSMRSLAGNGVINIGGGVVTIVEEKPSPVTEASTEGHHDLEEVPSQRHPLFKRDDAVTPSHDAGFDVPL